MADKSKIEWLDGGSTWNVAYGCSKVSDGCQNCFAHRMISTRFPHLTGCWNGPHRFEERPKGWDGDAHFKPERLEIPFHWKKPRRIFVCSMSDLFHESLTDEQIAAVFGVMAATPQHQYVILTKRLERAVEWFKLIEKQPDSDGPSFECAFHLLRQAEPDFDGPIHCRYGPNPDAKWPLPNVIMCASVENQPTVNERVSLLLQIPARWHGVSVEPILEPVRLNLATECDRQCAEYQEASCPGTNGKCVSQYSLDWVVCGAETGPGKRPFKDEWALDLRDQCNAASVPFFFKKDGAGKPALCGVEYHEWVK
jgi:protein gp37